MNLEMTDAYVGLDGLGQVGDLDFDTVNKFIDQGVTTAAKIVPLFQRQPKAPAPQIIRTAAAPKAPAAPARVAAPGKAPATKTDWGKILPWAIGGAGVLLLATSMRGGK